MKAPPIAENSSCVWTSTRAGPLCSVAIRPEKQVSHHPSSNMSCQSRNINMPCSLHQVLQGRLALFDLLLSDVPFCYFCAIKVHPEKSETEDVGTLILDSIMLRGRALSGWYFPSVRLLIESISHDPLLSPTFLFCFLLFSSGTDCNKKKRWKETRV